MMRVADVLATLERLAPAADAFAWDSVGLQVGDPEAEVSRVLVALDRSLAVIQAAAAKGAELVVTHHPLLFRPLPRVTTASYEGRAVLELARRGIALVTAHTNWDAAHEGVNDALAERLGLHAVRPFGGGAEHEELVLVTFVPPRDLQNVLDATSAAGAGQIGDYTRCAFYAEGHGTFQVPLLGNPHIGRPGSRETTAEVRVEMRLPRGRQTAVLDALLRSHPYEEVAYHFLPMSLGVPKPNGRLGELPEEVACSDFVAGLDARLGTRCLAWGDPARSVRKVAVVGGAADEEWRAARSSGADVFVTGEVKQHVALEASESGLPIVAAGHYATEQPGVEALAKALQRELPQAVFEVFTPSAGASGRPLD